MGTLLPDIRLYTHLTTSEIYRWDTILEAQEKEKESAVMLERRKEDLVRKAKEYHEELKTLLVCGMSTRSLTHKFLTTRTQHRKSCLKLRALL